MKLELLRLRLFQIQLILKMKALNMAITTDFY
jgi:hypothetical protein